MAAISVAHSMQVVHGFPCLRDRHLSTPWEYWQVPTVADIDMRWRRLHRAAGKKRRHFLRFANTDALIHSAQAARSRSGSNVRMRRVPRVCEVVFLEHGQVRVCRDQPFAAHVLEVHLQARVCATAFGAEYDAFAEAGVADALAKFHRQRFLQG